MRFKGKIALVTGSTKGIGVTAARRLAAEGASVMVTGRSEQAGERVVAAIREANGVAAFTTGDITKEGDVQATIKACVETFGGLHILVNSAGTGDIVGTMERPIAEQSHDQFEAIMRVGLYGVTYAIRSAIPQMLESGGGSIVNMSSVAGVQAVGGMPAYSSMKGAVQSLTRQIAADYGKRGIRSNCLVLGAIADTPVTDGVTGLNIPALDEAMRRPLLTIDGAMPMPDDVASAILFLSSDESKFINGALIPIDGGAMSLSHIPDMSLYLYDSTSV